MPLKKNGNGYPKPKKSKAAKVGKNMLAYLKSWDQFGHPVGLSLGGDSKYKTMCGSIATLALACIIVWVSYENLEPWFAGEINEVKGRLLAINRQTNEPYNPFKVADGLLFAIGSDIELDP